MQQEKTENAGGVNVGLNDWLCCPFCSYDQQKHDAHKSKMIDLGAFGVQPITEFLPKLEYSRFLGSYYVECYNCGIEVILHTKDRQEAVKIWNERAT